MSNIWQEKFTVRMTEIDVNERLKPSSLLQLMQEAADHSADNLGFGYEYVKATNTFWVLSRMKLIITRMPTRQEKLTIKTWPKGLSKAFALRDYEIYDEQNNCCVIATSAWLLLNGETHQIIRRPHFSASNNLAAIDALPQKLFTKELFFDVFKKHVRNSELDINNHVNNTRYLEWVIDALDYDVYQQRIISEIDINFISQTKYGDEVIIRKSNLIKQEGADCIYIDAINTTSGKRAIIVKLKLK